MARKLQRGPVRYYIAPVDADNNPTVGADETLPPGTVSEGLVYEAAPETWTSTDGLGPADVVDLFFVLSVPYRCFGCRGGKCVGCDDLHLMKQILLKKENAFRREAGKAPLSRMKHAHEYRGEACNVCSGTGKCTHCDGTARTLIPTSWARVQRNPRNQWRKVGG